MTNSLWPATATYQGVNVNATVSFAVPQAVAVGEAAEHGLDRQAAVGNIAGLLEWDGE